MLYKNKRHLDRDHTWQYHSLKEKPLLIYYVRKYIEPINQGELIMSEEVHTKHKHIHNDGSFGIVWVIGWMFTIGFLKLIWWKALLALVVWPWYLGVAIR